MMLTLDTFCCCNLRTGTILILWWNVIYSVNGMLVLAILAITFENDYCVIILPILFTGLIVSVCTLIHTPDTNETHSIQSRNIKWLRYSWYYNASLVFVLIISYIFVIYLISVQRSSKSPTVAAEFGFFFVLFSFFIGIQTYFTLVVYSYHKRIVEIAQNKGLNRAIPLAVRTTATTANNMTLQSHLHAPSAPTLPRNQWNDFVQVPTDPTYPPEI